MPKMQEKSKSFQSPRGTHDILPEDQLLWEKVRNSIYSVSTFYGFSRIDTPHFEDTDLFCVGTGKTTDIVSKQMYSFKTRGGDQLTLRPEGTPPVARAYIEHGMASWPQPVKLYYAGSFFRHESPQRGRYRELHQWGLELIGEDSAVADAEVIQGFYAFLKDWDITDVLIEINSVGCPACRPAYRSQLIQYYRSKIRGLCRDCKDRFKENPFRLLDCTQEKCMIVKKSAPQILDRLCEACRGHFKSILEFLEEAEIPYVLNPHLVRGLDYYTRTVFEFFVDDTAKKIEPTGEAVKTEGPQDNADPAEAKDEPYEAAKKLAVVGGGRYDGLIELIGGRPTPAVGGAMGLERLVGLIKARKTMVPSSPKPEVFLVQLGDLAKRKSFRIMEELRRAGITVAESLGRDSIRSQLKMADRMGAQYSLIFGQKEALDGMVILREMAGGIQESIPQSKFIDTLRRKLRKQEAK